MAKTINFVKNIACKAVLFGSESKNSNFSGEKRVFALILGIRVVKSAGFLAFLPLFSGFASFLFTF